VLVLLKAGGYGPGDQIGRAVARPAAMKAWYRHVTLVLVAKAFVAPIYRQPQQLSAGRTQLRLAELPLLPKQLHARAACGIVKVTRV
jgi:hypothetical protein